MAFVALSLPHHNACAFAQLADYDAKADAEYDDAWMNKPVQTNLVKKQRE
jgi:hypothetical protein